MAGSFARNFSCGQFIVICGETLFTASGLTVGSIAPVIWFVPQYCYQFQPGAAPTVRGECCAEESERPHGNSEHHWEGHRYRASGRHHRSAGLYGGSHRESSGGWWVGGFVGCSTVGAATWQKDGPRSQRVTLATHLIAPAYEKLDANAEYYSDMNACGKIK